MLLKPSKQLQELLLSINACVVGHISAMSMDTTLILVGVQQETVRTSRGPYVVLKMDIDTVWQDDLADKNSATALLLSRDLRQIVSYLIQQ
jgi:hypothetical protein